MIKREAIIKELPSLIAKGVFDTGIKAGVYLIINT
jgi:hypothetical protein